MRIAPRLAVLLTVAFLGTTLTGASVPAQAESVQTAQQRVDRLQDKARAATAELTKGTRLYERDQAALAAANRELRRSNDKIAVVRAEVAEGETQLRSMARQMYMTPGANDLSANVARTPDEVLDALQMSDAVSRIAGNQNDVIRRAVGARVRLQVEQQRVEQLTEQAKVLVARSAERLKSLNALASRTAAELESAQAALTTARQQAAAAAEARARAKAKAARARILVSPSGPACTGRSTEGQSNGNLDPGSLCPLWQAPGHRLRADAAKAFNSMSQSRAAAGGGPLCVTDSYRSYSEQAALYRRKPGLAAVPGTSNHGWGLALDLCGGVERFGSEAHEWMRANAGRFGFVHPEWAQRGGSKPEAWHWEYGG